MRYLNDLLSLSLRATTWITGYNDSVALGRDEVRVWVYRGILAIFYWMERGIADMAVSRSYLGFEMVREKG